MSEMDPRLLAAFDALRDESAAPADRAAMEKARAAMHQARAVQPQRRGLALIAEQIRHAVTPRRLLAGGAGLAAGLAVVAGLGWNAPAGSPLHGVRVAHEAVVLALPGSDRVGLDLDYAEARMREAQQQAGSWSSSLDEAGRLLDDARQHLVAGSPRWPRWENDEKLLGDLRSHDDHEHNSGGGITPGGSGESSESSGSGGASSAEGSGDQDSSSTSTSTSSHSQSASSSTSSQSQEHSSTTSQTSSSSGSDGGGGSGGGSSSSSSTSNTSSDGGGSDGH
jgi:hypothetical protein